MENIYYTCKSFSMIIDGINFGNINGYDVIKKGKKLYLKIDNEVLTNKQYERLLKLLRLCVGDYTFLIKIDYHLISEEISYTKYKAMNVKFQMETFLKY